MGFAELNSLQGRAATLNNNLCNLRSQLDIQKRRKEKLESLIRNLKNAVNNGSNNVDSKLSNIKNWIDDSLKGVISVEIIEQKLASDNEKDVYGDGYASSANSFLESECRNVCARIDELQRQINNTVNEIDNCNRQIVAEKSAIANSFKVAYEQTEQQLWIAKRDYDNEPTSSWLANRYYNAKANRDRALSTYNQYRGWL